MPDNPGTSQALADFWAALDAWGEPAILLGGLAVVAHGHRRGTVDIDATLMLDLARVDRTLGEFCAVLEDETRLAAWREIKAKVGRQDS